jgi:hypothetical protein
LTVEEEGSLSPNATDISSWMMVAEFPFRKRFHHCSAHFCTETSVGLCHLHFRSAATDIKWSGCNYEI